MSVTKNILLEKDGTWGMKYNLIIHWLLTDWMVLSREMFRMNVCYTSITPAVRFEVGSENEIYLKTLDKLNWLFRDILNWSLFHWCDLALQTRALSLVTTRTIIRNYHVGHRCIPPLQLCLSQNFSLGNDQRNGYILKQIKRLVLLVNTAWGWQLCACDCEETV